MDVNLRGDILKAEFFIKPIIKPEWLAKLLEPFITIDMPVTFTNIEGSVIGTKEHHLKVGDALNLKHTIKIEK